MKIAIKDITPCSWNPRKITKESVKELAESIKSQGLISPITVWMDGDRWFCIAGNRRLMAAKSAGLKEIECNEFKGSESEARAVTITENLQREDVSPMEESAAVAALLDQGLKSESVATKLGKTTGWVKRRAKLANLDESIKCVVDVVTLEVLERVSDYPSDQQIKIAKAIRARLKWYRDGLLPWNAIRGDVERLSMDLDSAVFDRKKCAKCSERTGADWFTDDEAGKLGRCLNCKCFEAKESEWKKQKVAETIGDIKAVECDSEWGVPYEVRQDLADKKSKKHPIAYYWFEDDEIVVKYGQSIDAIRAAKKAQEEAEAAERAEANAAAVRKRQISDKLSEAFPDDDDSANWPEGLIAEVTMMVNHAALDENQEQFVIDAIAGKMCSWRSYEDDAELLAAFPFVRKMADISDEDAEWFINEINKED